MSFIDVAIPGIIGLVLVIWPQSVFIGSSASPDAKKLRVLRSVGVVLLVIAAGYLAIKLAGA